jgi:hypothetical protein
MLVEEQKLRWCGMDMRARWRRQVAVALTYAFYLFVVWSYRTYLQCCQIQARHPERREG